MKFRIILKTDSGIDFLGDDGKKCDWIVCLTGYSNVRCRYTKVERLVNMKIEFKMIIEDDCFAFIFPANKFGMTIGGGEFVNPNGKYYPLRLYKIHDWNLKLF